MNADLSCPGPSAFSRARVHLKPSAFRALNDQLIETATDFGLRNNTWHDLRLLAIDGSTCRLPKASPDIAAYFGGTTSRHETFTPMARISYLYEVRTHLIIDGQISPYAVGEHAQAQELLGGNVWNGDCVLFDRGYNDPKGIAWILTQDSYFVRRVAVGNDKVAQDFVASGEAELEFDYTFKDSLIKEFKKLGLTVPRTTRLRFVRVDLDTGEVEVLLTNLLDKERYPAREFKALYNERWGVEEGIKTAKCNIGCDLDIM